MKNPKITDIVLRSEDERILFEATDDNARFTIVNRLFDEYFDATPEKMACAGGRVNLIGEHVDYPDLQFAGDDPVHLFSMGGAIQNNYIVACNTRDDGKIVAIQLECYQRLELDLSDLAELEDRAVSDRENALPKAERALPSWTVHTLGAIKEMVDRGAKVAGLNLLLTSNVPHGAGMSNSAANCVALGLVFNALYPELSLNESIDLVTFARQAENSRFAGGQCGWLDQLLIVNSKAHTLTKIDYADNGIEHFESRLPEHMQFVTYNTNVPHVLAESDYGHRVQELRLGIQFLSKLLDRNVGGPKLTLGTLNALITALSPSIDAITIPDALGHMAIVQGEAECAFDDDMIAKVVKTVEREFVVPNDLPSHRGKSTKESFAIILRRMRHQKMSSMLVPLAGEAASQGDAELFGLLLDLEGDSLRMSGDFMITGDNGAQDAMLDCALNTAKEMGLRVHGRMLGGGGGGNVLLFADTSNGDLFSKWEEATITAYDDWAEQAFPNEGIRATVISPIIAEGARLL